MAMSLPSTTHSDNAVMESALAAEVKNEAVARRQRRSFALPLGCFFIGLGILLSGTVLEDTILPAGTIIGTTRRAAALWLCRILLVVAGAYLLLKRPKITAVHLAALVPGVVLSGVVGAAALQVAFVLPRIVCGWKSDVPVTQQNQLRFRGRPIVYTPEDYVIVLLGDSQVEAAALPLDAMPEQRLESDLVSLGRKTRVISIGTGGYGQDQELLALQEYFQRHRADLVVLWQTPGNDIWNNLFKTHMINRSPKPTFSLDGSGRLLGPSEALGQPLANSKIVVVSLWERALGLPWRDKSWERQLPAAYVPMDHYDGPVRTEWQDRWITNLGRMRDENLATEKSHLVVGLTPRSPRMQYGLDLTRALTRRIQELAAANHARMVVFQASAGNDGFASDGDEVYVLNNKYYRVSKRQYLENWNYVNAGFDTETIPVRVKDWRVGPEDGHLSAPATDQVMVNLAKRLQSRIVDKAHPTGP
jgi:hypothetical protein